MFTPAGVAFKEVEILGKGAFESSVILENESGQSERTVSYYSHCPYAVEVAVNTETGEVKVLKVVASTDVKLINPKGCEAQYERGRMINPSFMNYKIPTVMEIPVGENIKSILASVPHKEGPYGAKGIGEATMSAISPAISNDIYNAVGVRIKKQPTSRQKLWEALQEKKAKEKAESSASNQKKGVLKSHLYWHI